MTPRELFDYASNYPETPGRVYPTVREAAKHFRVTQQAIIDACYDWQGDGYMRPATGIKVGSGIASIDRQGDYLVEAYR